MSIIRKSKSIFAILLALAIMIVAALPAYAADSASAAGVDIRLKLGSTQMTVNGQAVTVTAPFQKGGTTFVPLSVMTKGLGASLQLADNKKLTLKYGAHTVVITIGSKDEWVDGKKVVLAAAPVILNGVTMVPLRVVEAFGAKISIPAAKELRITAAKAGSGVVGGPNGIDTDAGKSKIGDSFYKWSMNYPTGLVQNYQSDNGNNLSFQDVKKEFQLNIVVEDAEEPLDADEQLDNVKDYIPYSQTTIDTKPIVRGGVTYQRVVTKGTDGFYYDYRGVQANGQFYLLKFGKTAKSAQELNASSVILDSFQTRFDASDKSLKDLTKVKNGLVEFKNDDYGLVVQLPHQWVKASSSGDSAAVFYGDDNAELGLDINSIQPGDTLDAMIARDAQMFKDTFAADYMTEPVTTDITWNGLPAKLTRFAFTPEGSSWVETDQVLAIKGKYKYAVTLAYKKDDKQGETALKQVQDSMKLDFAKIEQTLGDVPDPDDTMDRTAFVTKTSKKYGYSLSLAKHWEGTEKDFESDSISYDELGLNVSVYVDTVGKLDYYPPVLEKNLADSAQMKLKEKTDVTVSGAKGYKMTFEGVEDSFAEKSTATIYLLEHNGKVYLLQGVLAAFNDTEFNRGQLEQSLASFKFTDN